MAQIGVQIRLKLRMLSSSLPEEQAQNSEIRCTKLCKRDALVQSGKPVQKNLLFEFVRARESQKERDKKCKSKKTKKVKPQKLLLSAVFKKKRLKKAFQEFLND